MLVAIAIVAHVIGFASSIDAVFSTRTSQGAIAWAVVLNAFPWSRRRPADPGWVSRAKRAVPEGSSANSMQSSAAAFRRSREQGSETPYVAVPAYWVLGRSRFEGYVTARQGEDSEIWHVASKAGELAAPYIVAESDARYVEATRAGVALAKIPFLRGNETELLIDGEATFGSILDGIDRARDYILFQFFIVKHDELGTEVKDHLLARAREGVRVHILYDEVGSHDLSKEYKEELRAAGAELYDFHSQETKRPGSPAPA